MAADDGLDAAVVALGEKVYEPELFLCCKKASLKKALRRLPEAASGGEQKQAASSSKNVFVPGRRNTKVK